MVIKVKGPDKLNPVSLTPVRSKSISNRLQIIRMLTYPYFNINHISTANDTAALADALRDIKKGRQEIFAGAGGTSYRFLTAFLATKPGEWKLLGDDQLYKRPIMDLVNALKDLDAEIEYLHNVGFPPLKITGKKLKGGKIKINADVSSQFISALILVVPAMENGLEIELSGEVVSRPYIDMTLGLMSQFNIDLEQNKNHIKIKKGKYLNLTKVVVEPDWTAASYFYSIVALSANDSVFLNDYKKGSVQGDKRIAEIMLEYGVQTDFFEDGIHIKKGKEKYRKIELDLMDNPDLVPTLAVLSAALGIKTIFKNINHLAYKESNRLMALEQELKKLNASFKKEEATWILEPGKLPDGIPEIETYEDHRIAMAFAPLALLQPVCISNPSVVNKSYPEYWDHLQALGFSFT